MGIEKENYGVTKEGKQVTKYTLTNGQGASVSFLDYGAVIQSIIVPDKDGKLEDVVLGYDTLSGYESNVPSFGSPVGRCANRISNACFVLNGKEYPLDNNDATNCLHGGFLRYNYLMYDAECAISQDDASVSFSRVSPDGEQGFPGNLTFTITYTWNDANELMIEYNAVSDADTILNITNHSYFNIGCGGQAAGDVLGAQVQIASAKYTPINEKRLPTGEICDVADLPAGGGKPDRYQRSSDRGRGDAGSDEKRPGFFLSFPAKRGSGGESGGGTGSPASAEKLRDVAADGHSGPFPSTEGNGGCL